jgi:hypothetical protein
MRIFEHIEDIMIPLLQPNASFFFKFLPAIFSQEELLILLLKNQLIDLLLLIIQRQ